MSRAHHAPSLSQPRSRPQLSLLVTAQPPYVGTGPGDVAKSPRRDGDGRLQAVPEGTQRAQVVKPALLWRPDLGAGCCVSPRPFMPALHNLAAASPPHVGFSAAAASPRGRPSRT